MSANTISLLPVSLPAARARYGAILRSFTGAGWPSSIPGLTDMQEALAADGEPPWASWSRVILLQEGLDVAGWALATRSEERPERGLVDVFVRPESRRLGLGESLWHGSAQLLLGEGCEWVQTDRNPWSEALAIKHLATGEAVAVYSDLHVVEDGRLFEVLMFGGWA